MENLAGHVLVLLETVSVKLCHYHLRRVMIVWLCCTGSWFKCSM